MIGLLLARKMSVAGRLTAAAEANAIGFDDVRGLVRSIVLGLARDRGGDVRAARSRASRSATGTTSGEAAWHGLFHSVSSFNNAGFALFSDNLIGFAADPFICLPICARDHPRRPRLPRAHAAAQGVPASAALDA